MRFTRRLVLVLAVATVGLAALASSAGAATEPAAGNFVETPETILEERQSGGNTFIHLTRDAFITGTYTGIGHADQYIVIHADGSFNFHPPSGCFSSIRSSTPRCATAFDTPA